MLTKQIVRVYVISLSYIGERANEGEKKSSTTTVRAQTTNVKVEDASVVRNKLRRTRILSIVVTRCGGLYLLVGRARHGIRDTQRGSEKEFVLSRTRAQYKVTELARVAFRCKS